MIYFFDTSALVEYYTSEKGKEQVTAIIQDSETYILIPELTCIEIKRSLATKCRTGQMTQEERKTANESFYESLAIFCVEPINDSVCRNAGHLIRAFAVQYALRTSDAIQLATYRQLN